MERLRRLVTSSEPGGNMTVGECGLIIPDQLTEIDIAVADGLRQNGFEVKLLLREETWSLEPCDLLLVCGPMQSMAWAIQRLARERKHIRRIPVGVWFTEQVPSPTWPHLMTREAARWRHSIDRVVTGGECPRLPAEFAGIVSSAGRLRALGELLSLRDLGFLQAVYVFTETNRAFLHRFGLPARVVPMGFHSTFGQRQGLERDIDVVFLGSTRDRRRRRLVADLEYQLKRRGIAFLIKDGTPERGYVFSEERTALLNRAKIMLNLMRQPWDDPVFRMLLAAPNGAMLLSETVLSTSTGPFRAGQHFAIAKLEDLPDAVEFYLRSPDLRTNIIEHAYQAVTQDFTMAQMARKVLDVMVNH